MLSIGYLSNWSITITIIILTYILNKRTQYCEIKEPNICEIRYFNTMCFIDLIECKL